MGKHAALVYDHIEIDTDAWIAARTGGTIDTLTNTYSAFAQTLAQALPRPVDDPLALFITARAGTAWDHGEFAVIRTAGDGHGARLTDAITVYRYEDPEHGDIAFIATGGKLDAYTDSTTDATDWLTFETQIFCPHGHGWLFRGGELYDADLSARTISDVFGPDGMIRTDTDPQSPTFGDARITCATCGADCDVEITAT